MQLFWGKIIGGQKRGKTLGFPTANMALHKNIPEGIYVSSVRIDKKWHNALTFVGKAITFGATKPFAESYLMDFSGNLYGKYITVKLLEKIRENKKFDSAAELIKQMEKDFGVAKQYFEKKF